MSRTLILILLMALVSCGDVDDTQDTNGVISGGQADYSGITEVDENMTFKSVDPDDWRDDGILVDCVLYPNPIKQASVCFETRSANDTVMGDVADAAAIMKGETGSWKRMINT